jgi:hypothetical protein
MSKRIINPAWVDKIKSSLLQGEAIDDTTAFKPATQWLIMHLSSCGVPYKIYNLGAGVTRVTTKTDVCPCCKQKVKP